MTKAKHGELRRNLTGNAAEPEIDAQIRVMAMYTTHVVLAAHYGQYHCPVSLPLRQSDTAGLPRLNALKEIVEKERNKRLVYIPSTCELQAMFCVKSRRFLS
jgi:hypothetical protein